MSKFTDLLESLNEQSVFLLIAKPFNPERIAGATDIAAAASGNKLTSSSTDLSALEANTQIIISGFTNSENNGIATVDSVTSSEAVLSGITLVNESAGNAINIGGQHTLYFSTDGFATEPGDTPPNQIFEAYLSKEEPLIFTRSMYDGSSIGGNSLPGRGRIRVFNTDGTWDNLRTWGWQGRSIKVLMGGLGFAFADYGTVLNGVADDVTFNEDAFSIQARDLQQLLDTPIDVGKFKGTGGLEGTQDLEDQEKPACFGLVRAADPVFLGIVGGLHKYQLHDGPIEGVERLWVAGVEWDEVASDPGAAEWTQDKSNSIITLGGEPGNGTVICQARGHADTAGGTAKTSVSDVVRAMVTNFGPLDDPDDLNTTSFSDLNSANSAVIGYYARERTNLLDALDEIVNSIGGYYGATRDGKFVVGRFEAPTGTPDLSLVKEEIIDIERPQVRRPLHRLTLGYQRAWREHTRDELAASIGDNFVTNGNFETDTDWTKGTGWTISSGTASHSSGSAGDLEQTGLTSLTTDQDYVLTFDVLNLTAGNLEVFIGASSVGTFSTNDSHEVRFTGAGETSVRFAADANFDGDLDNVFLRNAFGDFVTKQYRTVTTPDAESEKILVRRPSAIDERFDTLLDTKSDAQTERDRQYALLSDLNGTPEVFRIITRTTPLQTDVNGVIDLTYDRWGFDNGDKLRVLEIEENLANNRTVITGWRRTS